MGGNETVISDGLYNWLLPAINPSSTPHLSDTQ